MARVSISEAARLSSVSRPTIYKMIKSGQLTYSSVVKHGKSVKTIDTSELLRVFGSLESVSDRNNNDVKLDTEPTAIDMVFLQSLQHQVELLQAENMGLKDAVNARDEHISSLRQAMQLLEHKNDQIAPQERKKTSWWPFRKG
ncbi:MULTISPECIES: helix-turn-helix domain-containing protein [Enterobacteriaceae]|uniref:helix-turn-helix domain-containing protein n=1 Tax=Enterobacteriaceae TaxID=543 RepID=UPI00301BB268